jgi:hypothetical protein
MSRARLLTILGFVLLVWPAFAAADPLLTKAQIAKAADKIDACLANQTKANNPKPVVCIGIIKGPCDDAISAGGEAAHATCSDNETAAWDVLLNRSWPRSPPTRRSRNSPPSKPCKNSGSPIVTPNARSWPRTTRA